MIARGSPSRSSGRVFLRPTRSTSVATSLSSHTADSALEDQRARRRLDERAAAGGEHAVVVVEQPRDHAPLAVAEMGLAVFVEDVAHAHLRRLLDLLVGVGEGKIEQLRELAPDGRLADAHHADEHHGPVDARGERLDRAVGKAAGFDGHCRMRYR